MCASTAHESIESIYQLHRGAGWASGFSKYTSSPKSEYDLDLLPNDAERRPAQNSSTGRKCRKLRYFGHSPVHHLQQAAATVAPKCHRAFQL
eukprot:2408647-Amphidinium_carterae.1